MAKEARYGKYKYYRSKIRSPSGEVVQIYGKTKAERDQKVEAQKAAWAAEAETAASPFVW